jgi:membrane protein
MKLQIAGRDVVVLAKKTLQEVLDDNVLGLSAETAYSFFFGIFPTFLFAAPLLSLVGRKQQIFDEISAWLASSLPPDAFTLLRGVLHDVVFAENAPGLISLGAVLALYGGAGMFSSLMSALNTAYDIHDSRPWWEQKLIAMGATIGAIFTIGSAMVLLLGGDSLAQVIANAFGLGPVTTALWTLVQDVLLFVLLTGGIWGIYMVLPDVKAQSKTQTLVGAVLAAILWVLLSLAFRVYVTNFGTYNRTYGTVGAVIVLLTWMYLSMLAVLIGGELNSELRAGTGSAAIPSGKGESGRGHRIATHEGLPYASS